MEMYWLLLIFVFIIRVKTAEWAAHVDRCYYSIPFTDKHINFTTAVISPMSPHDCFVKCDKHRPKFFGISQNRLCVCSVEDPAHALVAPPLTCSFPCLGGGDDCGGPNATSVYTVARAKLGWVYVGCYLNDKLDVALPVSGAVTVEECYRACHQQDRFMYFGLRDGDANCYCGNAPGTYGQQIGHCGPCKDEPSEHCGTGDHSAIYAMLLSCDEVPAELKCQHNANCTDDPLLGHKCICKNGWTGSTCADKATAGNGVCDVNWRQYENRCYRYMAELNNPSRDWESAKAVCSRASSPNNPGTLVTLHTKEEWEYVQGLGKQYWIGLSYNSTSKEWMWESEPRKKLENPPVDPLFSSVQVVNTSVTVPVCAAAGSDGQNQQQRWQTNPCSYLHNFVCMKKSHTHPCLASDPCGKKTKEKRGDCKQIGEGDGYSCTCNIGWENEGGQNCKRRSNPCCQVQEDGSVGPCKNNGVCHSVKDKTGEYKCDCHDGYQGVQCQKESHDFKEIGCYNMVRPEQWDQITLFTSDNSPYHCYTLCLALGYRYFGVFEGRWCSCSNALSYLGSDEVHASACHDPCTGDIYAFCGSSFHVLVYEISIPHTVKYTLQIYGTEAGFRNNEVEFIETIKVGVPTATEVKVSKVWNCDAITLCAGDRCDSHEVDAAPGAPSAHATTPTHVAPSAASGGGGGHTTSSSTTSYYEESIRNQLPTTLRIAKLGSVYATPIPSKAYKRYYGDHSGCTATGLQVGKETDPTEAQATCSMATVAYGKSRGVTLTDRLVTFDQYNPWWHRNPEHEMQARARAAYSANVPTKTPEFDYKQYDNLAVHSKAKSRVMEIQQTHPPPAAPPSHTPPATPPAAVHPPPSPHTPPAGVHPPPTTHPATPPTPASITTPPTQHTPPAAHPPPTPSPTQGFQHLILPGLLAWDDAKKQCEAQGYTLPYFKTEAEKNEVLAATHSNINIWVNSQVSGLDIWNWLNDHTTVAPTFWAPGQPQSAVFSQCAALVPAVKALENKVCTSKYQAVCIKRQAPPPTIHAPSSNPHGPPSAPSVHIPTPDPNRPVLAVRFEFGYTHPYEATNIHHEMFKAIKNGTFRTALNMVPGTSVSWALPAASCIANLCKHQSRCVNLLTTFKCECSERYLDGTFCERNHIADQQEPNLIVLILLIVVLFFLTIYSWLAHVDRKSQVNINLLQAASVGSETQQPTYNFSADLPTTPPKKQPTTYPANSYYNPPTPGQPTVNGSPPPPAPVSPSYHGTPNSHPSMNGQSSTNSPYPGHY